MPSRDERTFGFDDQTVGALRNHVRSGEVILFTGAGFSRDARAADGEPIPSSQELRKILWPIAFPGEPEDAESSLGDIFDCAVTQSGTRVRETLESCLRVDHTSLPEYYAVWFSVPWIRAYTLNIDDLELAAERSLSLRRGIEAISMSDPVPTPSEKLAYIHLNGQLHDLPNVTFSSPQYGSRIPGRDPWYSTLVADLMSRTVVFVGTTLDEPPLWHHLELRGSKPHSRELRPRSYLVAPELSIARQQMLKRFNIDHIPMDARQFAERVLTGMADAIDAGHDRLSGAAVRHRRSLVIPSISELRQDHPEINLGQYLLGREPTFRDVSDGFAVQRSFEESILADSSILKSRLLLITGTAGTGKTTALLRLALSLDAAGLNVGWLDPTEVEIGLRFLRSAIADSEFDYVVIDDVDLFAAQAGPLLKELADTSSAPQIIAAARSTRAERFSLRDDLMTVDARFVVAPPLTDADIDALIDALKSAGLLGQLAGLNQSERRQTFKGLAGRQLLVAMIEATSGRRFSEKIDDECSQLPREQMLLYAICALATRYRIGLDLDEILTASGEASAEQLARVDALKRQYLLIETSDDRLIVRHRIVAEQVISWLRREGQLAEPVTGLLFAMAVQFLPDRRTSSRAFRVLVRLLNHQFMIEEIRNPAAVRQVYESISSVLGDDFHFWLQRGSFELERGDLDLAENYLNQARGLASEDYRVRTAWSYMSLRRAAELAQNAESGWRERADQAMAELADVIEIRGAIDSYATHTLGSQGLHYARRAPLSTEDKTQLLERLRRAVTRGIAMHPQADDLRQLGEDLEKEYLRLAVPPSQNGDRLEDES